MPTCNELIHTSVEVYLKLQVIYIYVYMCIRTFVNLVLPLSHGQLAQVLVA